MKSERRHQLERNELADRLGIGVAAIQPVLPFILGGLAILAVGSIAWGIYSTSSQKHEAKAWTEYYFSLTDDNTAGEDQEERLVRITDDYLYVADEFPKSTASAWARQSAGDMFLAYGIETIYTDRAKSESWIGQAVQAFEDVLNSSPNDTLRAKALVGLGQAYETTGELEKANEYYQQILTTPSLPPRLLSDVSQRVSFLQSENGKEFYSWFTALNPAPELPPAIDVSNVSAPTIESDGLQFEDPAASGDSASGDSASGESASGDSASGDSASVVPEIDMKEIALPELEAPTAPKAPTLGDLELPDQSGDSGDATEASKRSESDDSEGDQSTSAGAGSLDPPGAGTESGPDDS